jgi:hypothetical protein
MAAAVPAHDALSTPALRKLRAAFPARRGCGPAWPWNKVNSAAFFDRLDWAKVIEKSRGKARGRQLIRRLATSCPRLRPEGK